MIWFLLLSLGQNPITLDTLIAKAMENNGDLVWHGHLADAAREEAAAHSYLPDPNVKVGLYLQPVETRVGPQRASLGASQKVPWPGMRKAMSSIDLGRAEIHRQDRVVRASVLRRDLTKSWYQLYFLQHKKMVEEESFQLVRQLEKVARARFRTSQSSFAFVVQAQSSLAELTEQIAATQDDIDAMIARMSGMAGLKHPFQVSTIELPKIIDQPLPSQPLVDQLEAQAEVARRKMELVAFDRKPSLNLGFNYIHTDSALVAGTPDSGKDPLIATLGFNVPLNRGRTKARMATQRAIERATYARQEQVRKELSAASLEHRTLRTKALRRIKLYSETLIPQAHDALDATLKAFRTGELEFTSVINAQQTLLRMQLDLERAHADAHIHTAELDWLSTPETSEGASTP